MEYITTNNTTTWDQIGPWIEGVPTSTEHYILTTSTLIAPSGWNPSPSLYSINIGAIGTGPLGSFDDPVEELRKRCQTLEDWYADKLCKMIAKMEENEYEINDLKKEIEDLKATLKRLVDVLVAANE
jgi:hypothetical protein